MKGIGKWKIAILGVMVLCLGIFVTSLGYTIKTNKSQQSFYKELHRAEVANYFYNAYNVEIGSDQVGWNKTYGVEVPNKMLNTQIQESIKRDERIRVLSRTYGLDIPPTYNELIDRFETYNQNRLLKIAQGEVIYGPEQYTLHNYYRYLYGNSETQIIEAIMEDAKANKKDELREYSDKMDNGAIMGSFVGTLITYSIEPEEYQEQPNAVKKTFNAINQRLGDTKAYLTQEDVDSFSNIPVFVSEIILDSKNVSGDDLYTAELIGAIRKLKQGDYFSAPMGADSEYEKTFYISDIKTNRSGEFLDNINFIASQYAIEAYEGQLEK